MKKVILILTLCINTVMVYAQKPIVLMVKDLTGGQSVKIKYTKSSTIFEPDVLLDEQVSTINILTDSTYKISIPNISKPTLLICNLSNYTWKTVLAYPGDSLQIVVEKSKDLKNRFMISYRGVNAQNYEISKILDLIDEKPVYLDTPKTYNDVIKYLDVVNLKIKNNINNSIYKKNVLLTDIFHGLNDVKIRSEIYFALKKYKISYTLSNHLNFISKYLPVIAKERNSLLMSTNQYAYNLKSVLNLINIYENPNDDFINKTKIINKYFKGKSAGLLLSNSYYKFTQSSIGVNSDLVLSNIWYKKNRGKLISDEYNHFIDAAYARINLLNKPWPEEVLSLNFYEKDNIPIKFKDILLKHKGKIIVLDHWATWCGPCIEEFTTGKNTINELQVKGVKFIYISIEFESETKKMDEIIKKYNLDSYRIDQIGAKVYKDYISLRSIPRYLLINENGTLSNINLPKPSENFNFKQMLNYSIQRNN